MTLKVVWTNEFKKDYKLMLKRHKDISKLDKIIDVGGRGGFYTNARVKIGHWRHQMHTILAHSYPSVAS